MFRTRNRQILAIATSLLMRIAQALPAVAACVCDTPTGMPCCDAKAGTAPERAPEPTCCREEPAEAPETCSANDENPDLAGSATLSNPGCEMDYVSDDLEAAAVPGDLGREKIDAPETLADSPTRSTPAASPTGPTIGPDPNPPRPASSPLFLRQASLLL